MYTVVHIYAIVGMYVYTLYFPKNIHIHVKNAQGESHDMRRMHRERGPCQKSGKAPKKKCYDWVESQWNKSLIRD